MATDPEHKFELALALNQLDIALQLAREANVDLKWKTVGDAALSGWDVALAAECFTHAKDLGSLLLLHSSTGDREGLSALATQAEEAGSHNIAFTCWWLLGDSQKCTEILSKTGRLPEAVLFSQTYRPSLTSEVAKEWKESLEKNKRARVAKLLGLPKEDDNLFPQWDEWLKLEQEGGTAADIPSEETNGKDEAEGEPEAEADGEAEEDEDDDVE